MKKIFAFLLVVSFTLVLVACGDNNAGNNEERETGIESVTSEDKTGSSANSKETMGQKNALMSAMTYFLAMETSSRYGPADGQTSSVEASMNFTLPVEEVGMNVMESMWNG